MALTSTIVQKRFGEIVSLLESKKDSLSNEDRRIMYSKVELLKMDIQEDAMLREEEAMVVLVDKLEEMAKSLSLTYRKKTTLEFLIGTVRAIGAWLYIVDIALFMPIPCMLVGPIERTLVQMGILPKSWQLNLIIRNWCGSLWPKVCVVSTWLCVCIGVCDVYAQYYV